MKKLVTEAFGKKIYLLGEDHEGTKYWLKEPSWDCGKYWGFGYVETYTNNRNPGNSRGMATHDYFDSMFLDKGVYAFDEFREFFKSKTISDEDLWKLLDFMSSAYKLRDAAYFFQHGHSYYTKRAAVEELVDQDLADEINKNMLPKLFDEIKGLLEGE